MFGVTPEEVFKALGEKLAKLIENPPEDTTPFHANLRTILDALKKDISREVKSELLTGVANLVASHRPNGSTMDELREHWRIWLPDHRILCLTESPDHAAMWYHYGDRYCGVVLEIKCVDELDSAWLAARPVTYPPEKPAIYTVEGWADLLCLPQEMAIKSIFDTATYTKAPDWSYEKEWRVASFKRPEETGHFSDYKFDRSELAAIYFGPMISPEDRLSLTIAAGAFPTAQLWDVTIGMSREFTFCRVNS